MAENKTILQLNEVTANASGDVFPVVQNGVTQKTTLSKIKTFFDEIYTTTSAVASQISTALADYVTSLDLDNILSDYALKTTVATKQDKQSLTVVNIDAQAIDPVDTVNCILSITNFPSRTGNRMVQFLFVLPEDESVMIDDIFVFTVKYAGYSINLRSYSLEFDINDNIMVSLYLNVDTHPTKPVIISMNKIN